MAKGSVFEREICKELSLWITSGERDDIFWRTAGSGGRATMRKKSGKTTANQEGDVCATDPIGQPLVNIVTIELKKGYNSWNIKELIDTKKKNMLLADFWDQCRREKENSKSIGFWLITRQDRKRKLLFFDEGFFRHFRRKKNNFEMNHIRTCWNGDFIYCVDLEEFLKKYSPNNII